MRNKLVNPIQRENGFVLVTALLIMLVLSIIGIATTTNTSIELQIAGNDKVHKTTFYEAEGGIMTGIEVMEQAFNCSGGFTKTGSDPHDATVDIADLPPKTGGTPVVRAYNRGNNLAFWLNSYPPATKIGNPDQADFAYPISALNANRTSEVAYIYTGGQTQMLQGGALQMAAGYEGKGKSSAQGGVTKFFDIYAQFNGKLNSEAIILIGWRHLVGSEGSCIY